MDTNPQAYVKKSSNISSLFILFYFFQFLLYPFVHASSIRLIMMYVPSCYFFFYLFIKIKFLFIFIIKLGTRCSVKTFPSLINFCSSLYYLFNFLKKCYKLICVQYNFKANQENMKFISK